MRFFFILTLLCLGCGMHAAPAAAQTINRCVDPDEKIIFTDKKCEDINAVPQAVPKPMLGNSSYSMVRTCARTQEDLLWDLRGALETGDINRASGLFLWSGSDTAQANRRLDQLNQISYQSLISVDLLFPESDYSTVRFDDDGNIIEPISLGPAAPYGIQVDFYKNKKQTETRFLRFGIEKHMQCYWARF